MNELRAEGLHKYYRLIDTKERPKTHSPITAQADEASELGVAVLTGVDLCVSAGEFVAVVGASGSGKSTLLHLLAGLDSASSGRVLYGGCDIARLTDGERDRLRNRAFGFMYQFHHLLPELSALDNVALPRLIRRESQQEARQHAAGALIETGLGQRLHHRPGELSGGERQRVALARAIASEPQLIFADEPTGNLDERTAHGVFELLRRLTGERGVSVIMVTHDSSLAKEADRILELRHGQLIAVGNP